MDLGGSHAVEKVVLFNRTGSSSHRLSNFRVDYLDAVGKVLSSRTHSGTAGVETSFDLVVQGVYAVRVQLNGTNPLSLAEVQVLGAPGGGGDTGGGDTDDDDNKDCTLEDAEFTIAVVPDLQKITTNKNEGVDYLRKAMQHVVVSVGDLVQSSQEGSAGDNRAYSNLNAALCPLWGRFPSSRSAATTTAAVTTTTTGLRPCSTSTTKP